MTMQMFELFEQFYDMIDPFHDLLNSMSKWVDGFGGMFRFLAEIFENFQDS